jgi:hypothetical protein
LASKTTSPGLPQWGAWGISRVCLPGIGRRVLWQFTRLKIHAAAVEKIVDYFPQQPLNLPKSSIAKLRPILLAHLTLLSATFKRDAEGNRGACSREPDQLTQRQAFHNRG